MSHENILLSVTRQTGTAILDFDGRVLKSSGDLEMNSDDSLATLYNILKDSLKLKNDIKKVTVLYNDFNYVLSMNEKNVFIVKVQSG
mmetsp:Transcript_33960/g.32397  ORF Transcript_33960/g.32397 Transcript_33960/m.32397 type:complete len:87 (+) Transcript_33960:91-351(+)